MENRAIWDGWETVKRIGSGSFGTVYEIKREVGGHEERAALKVITIPQEEGDIDACLGDGYDKESIAERYKGFLNDVLGEYGIMAAMKGCSNIVYCDDIRYQQHDDEMGWDIYIKMELLTPLHRSIGETITDDQVIKIGKDICNALVFCEKKRVVHRDVKPQNIFVSPDGTYKLGDFGIAKTVERTTSGTKTGTYQYMAPEVYKDEEYGTKVDIYSLGLVLYWLLNERRLPFLPLPPKKPTATEEQDARKKRFAGEVIPEPKNGSRNLKKIVLKACAYDSKDRYQSAEEMLQDLIDVTEGRYRVSFSVQKDNSQGEQEGYGLGVQPGEDEETEGAFGNPGTKTEGSSESPEESEPLEGAEQPESKDWLDVVKAISKDYWDLIDLSERRYRESFSARKDNSQEQQSDGSGRQSGEDEETERTIRDPGTETVGVFLQEETVSPKGSSESPKGFEPPEGAEQPESKNWLEVVKAIDRDYRDLRHERRERT